MLSTKINAFTSSFSPTDINTKLEIIDHITVALLPSEQLEHVSCKKSQHSS